MLYSLEHIFSRTSMVTKSGYVLIVGYLDLPMQYIFNFWNFILSRMFFLSSHYLLVHNEQTNQVRYNDCKLKNGLYATYFIILIWRLLLL